MTDHITSQIKQTHSCSERISKIALKLLQQLKDEKISFSDAERILDIMKEWLEIEKTRRLL